MTTIYINLIKGTIYTDSRCTTVVTRPISFIRGRNKLKILGFEHSQKIFAMHRSGVVVSGDQLVSDYLKALFESGKNPASFKLPKSLRKRPGCIHIVRPGYTIGILVDAEGKITTTTHIGDNLTSGSGSTKGFLQSAQGYLWALSRDQIEKVLRLSSLFDVYSDDNIACMTSDEYRR